MKIPQPSPAQLPRLIRRLALLAIGVIVLGVDGFARSGLLLAVAHDLGVSRHRAARPSRR